MEKFYIKKTTEEGSEPLFDCRNLSYEEAVEQLDLFEQRTGFEDWEPDRQLEDALCLNHTDGSFTLYEIEEEAV